MLFARLSQATVRLATSVWRAPTRALRRSARWGTTARQELVNRDAAPRYDYTVVTVIYLSVRLVHVKKLYVHVSVDTLLRLVQADIANVINKRYMY